MLCFTSKIKFLICLSSFAFCLSCGFSSNDGQYAEINPLEQQFHPFRVKVFHTSQDTTTLYLQLNAKTQGFAFADSGRFAKLKLSYTLASDRNMARILLKKNRSFVFSKRDLIQDTIFVFHLPIKTDDEVYLEIQVKDEVLNRLFEKSFLLKKDTDSPHNLMITHLENPVFPSFINVEKKYLFRYKDRQTRKLYLFQTQVDSVRDRYFELASNTPVSFEGEAYYKVCLSPQQENCVSLFVMREGFPYLYRKKNMLAPLRLLVSDTTEYFKVAQSGHSVAQTEFFWLQLARNDLHLAKKLIEVFYRRYEYANAFFTVGQPGWQTDMGKAYILFGYPSTILDHTDFQEWHYGFTNTSFPYSLTFQKREIYGLVSYHLRVDDTFLEMLNLAKAYWRQGVVFDDDVIKNIQYEKEEDQKRQFANPWGSFRY